MSKVNIGKKVPAFSLPATGNQTIKLSAIKGKNIVLYFGMPFIDLGLDFFNRTILMQLPLLRDYRT